MNSDEYGLLLKERERLQQRIAGVNQRIDSYEAWLETQSLRIGDDLLVTRDYCHHWLEQVQSPLHLLGYDLYKGKLTVMGLGRDFSDGVTVGFPGAGLRIPYALALSMRQAWLLRDEALPIGFKVGDDS